jgi:hypothetical protein
LPNTVTITGFKEYGAKLQKAITQFPNELDEAAKFAAANWTQLADRAAPKDFGKLHGSISAKQDKVGVWEVVSPKEYSAYMEWGTKSRARIPAELQGYAAQFRGTGAGKGVKELIYAWVLRKGLGKDAQWPIFISIMRTGVNPHPFFFIHRPVIEKQLFADLKQILETI